MIRDNTMFAVVLRKDGARRSTGKVIARFENQADATSWAMSKAKRYGLGYEVVVFNAPLIDRTNEWATITSFQTLGQ